MAIPVKVIAIEVSGLVLDVSALVECQSDNEDIIKVGLWERRAPKPFQVILEDDGMHLSVLLWTSSCPSSLPS